LFHPAVCFLLSPDRGHFVDFIIGPGDESGLFLFLLDGANFILSS